MLPDAPADVLRHVGGGVPGGCDFGTGDGPCPNPSVTTIAMAAAHPRDGRARWLVPAWTPACAWHRDTITACVDADPDVPTLWVARGGSAHAHPPVSEPMRTGLARWLERTPDGLWSGELGL